MPQCFSDYKVHHFVFSLSKIRSSHRQYSAGGRPLTFFRDFIVLSDSIPSMPGKGCPFGNSAWRHFSPTKRIEQRRDYINSRCFNAYGGLAAVVW